jgi:hypothetical protein
MILERPCLGVIAARQGDLECALDYGQRALSGREQGTIRTMTVMPDYNAFAQFYDTVIGTGQRAPGSASASRSTCPAPRLCSS